VIDVAVERLIHSEYELCHAGFLVDQNTVRPTRA
jgi:hypothetical protein